MGNGGRYNLRRAGKRRVREEEEEDTSSSSDDRLSHLPEPILCHILSFLDTKSAVQTSVLSRAWISSWKYVPVLDLRRDAFRSFAAFKRFVHKVLFWRSHLNVRKVCYVDNVGRRRDQSVIMRVIKYASSHDIQHIVVEAASKFTDPIVFCEFSSVFGSILNSNLKSLELGCVVLDSGFGSSGFQMLTSLHLNSCVLLRADQREDPDPFSNFPCLTNLVMCDVFPRGLTMKVCGPQLLSLELHGMETVKIEIFAPKLKSFRVCQFAPTRGFSKVTLPSLDHADIALSMANKIWSQIEVFEERMRQHVRFLFQGLHNAKTLKLDATAIKILTKICRLGEQQPSPFRRLESLIVATDRVPVKVVNYLFNASSCEEPDILINLDP